MLPVRLFLSQCFKNLPQEWTQLDFLFLFFIFGSVRDIGLHGILSRWDFVVEGSGKVNFVSG